MCNKCAEHMQEATVLNEAVNDMSLTVERLEAQNAYLKADRDQTAEGLAAAQDYVGCLEAERDILVMRVDYLTADRDRLRDERNELRDRADKQSRMRQHLAEVQREQLVQALENYTVCASALSRANPEEMARVRPFLHENIREMDKVICDVTRANQERDALRQERNALRDELTALKRRITSRAAWQEVYLGG